MATTPPRRPSPASPTETSTSSASLASFLEALSEASSLPRSSKHLFSPTQTNEGSAETGGTGATGDTEREGDATRSLIRSVTGRGEDRDKESRERLTSADGASRGSGSWVELEEREGGDDIVDRGSSERDGGSATESKTPSLVWPRTEVPLEGNDNASVASEVCEAPLAQNEADPSQMSIDRLSRDDVGFDDTDMFPTAVVTNSQEAVGLSTSVTRSQSDFTKWLEDTMRLAKGDGTSTMETDDALSSILEATRQTRFGHSTSSVVNDDHETPSLLESPVFPGDTTLQIDDDAQEDEEKEKEEEDLPEQANEGEDAQGTGQIELKVELGVSDAARSVARKASNGTLLWKFLSLGLALALSYSLQRQYQLSVKLTTQHPPPTRSTRFVPFDTTNSTLASFSPFATPIVVGDPFPLPVLAFFLAIMSAIPASLLLFRRGSNLRDPNGPDRDRHRSDSCFSTTLQPNLTGDAVLTARERLVLGERQFSASRLRDALSTFSSVGDLACAPADKALAADWAGRTLYVLARAESRVDRGGSVERRLYEDARKQLERSIRLDRTRAGPRARLGLVLHRLGNLTGAITAFESAIKRDEDHGAWVHEWLAKALYQATSSSTTSTSPATTVPHGKGKAMLIEQHLRRALELDPTSYSALSFLGEILHLQGGRSSEARSALKRSIRYRADQPQVHVRIAFIANERLEPGLAAQHFRLALASRSTGRQDDACPVSRDALRGITPFLSLYFVIDKGDPAARIDVLRQALEEHPHDELVELLYAIRTARMSRASPCAAVESTPPRQSTAEGSDPTSSASALDTKSAQLARRVTRYPHELLPSGLYALALLALDDTNSANAAFATFSKAVAHRRARHSSERCNEPDEEVQDEKRKVAFIVMAFYELKNAREANGPSPWSTKPEVDGSKADAANGTPAKQREEPRRPRRKAIDRDPAQVAENKSVDAGPVRRSTRVRK
ncbi:hypothetical protein JCM10212_001323 [Sporobolomyces blumeae]